jgi:hypothetical protein
MVQEAFNNKDRTRYYGLRIGDIVNLKGIDGTILHANAEITGYGSDNNRVCVEYEEGENIIWTEWVAEWCEIVIKVEDWIKNQLRPIVCEAFADNGEHSHWRLIDPKTGKLLWSELPEEDKIIYIQA